MTDAFACTVQERHRQLLDLKAQYLDALNAIDRDLKMLESALRLAHDPVPYPEPQRPLFDAIELYAETEALRAVASASIKPPTQIDVLVALARSHQDRTVHLTTAAKHILANGMSKAKNPGNVSATLHAQVTKDARWRKVGPGIFQLIAEQETATYERQVFEPTAFSRLRGGIA